jgi:hypothetical protein
MNKETLRMQMLAGLITESQYKTSLDDINEGLGDGPLDKLFHEEFPKNEKEILKFLAKHKKGISNSEKKYYVERYLDMIEKNK